MTPSNAKDDTVEAVALDDLIDKAWSEFVNCSDDRYFGNRSKLAKQKAVLRRFAIEALRAHDSASKVSGAVTEAMIEAAYREGWADGDRGNYGVDYDWKFSDARENAMRDAAPVKGEGEE